MSPGRIITTVALLLLAAEASNAGQPDTLASRKTPATENTRNKRRVLRSVIKTFPRLRPHLDGTRNDVLGKAHVIVGWKVKHLPSRQDKVYGVLQMLKKAIKSGIPVEERHFGMLIEDGVQPANVIITSDKYTREDRALVADLLRFHPQVRVDFIDSRVAALFSSIDFFKSRNDQKAISHHLQAAKRVLDFTREHKFADIEKSIEDNARRLGVSEQLAGIKSAAKAKQ